MGDFLRALLLLVVVCDPLGVLGVATVRLEGASSRGTRWFASVSAASAFALLALAAFGAETFMGALDLSAGSLSLGSAIVVVVAGVWLLARGDRRDLAGERAGTGWRDALVPATFPMLAGPAPLLVAATLATTRGVGATVAAAAVVTVVAAGLVATAPASAARRMPALVHGVGGRVVGAAMLFVALGLAVEGLLGT